jgi:hypothetical protein
MTEKLVYWYLKNFIITLPVIINSNSMAETYLENYKTVLEMTEWNSFSLSRNRIHYPRILITESRACIRMNDCCDGAHFAPFHYIVITYCMSALTRWLILTRSTRRNFVILCVSVFVWNEIKPLKHEPLLSNIWNLLPIAQKTQGVSVTKTRRYAI